MIVGHVRAQGRRFEPCIGHIFAAVCPDKGLCGSSICLYVLIEDLETA